MNRGNMNVPSVPTEVGKNALLFIAAWFIDVLANHGAIFVTLLAITYGILQIVFRTREYKAIMKTNEPKDK